MTRYFILIYKKGSKKPTGLIPTRKGISKLQIQKQARKQISKSFNYKIITEMDLKRLYKGLLKK